MDHLPHQLNPDFQWLLLAMRLLVIIAVMRVVYLVVILWGGLTQKNSNDAP